MPDDAIISEMEVTPTVLTLAGTDSVFVEAVVATRGFAVMAEMGGPRPWLRYALAAGDSLILDANTPAGVYDLADGRQILLGPPGGYPRSYGIRERAHPMLIFSVASRRRVGVLVASEETRTFSEPSDASVATLFRSGAQYRSWTVHREEPLAFAVPLDWYRRAWIQLPDSLTNYRVLFFGYGDSGEAPPRRPIRRFGEVRFEGTAPPARRHVVLPGAERLDLIGEIRLVLNGPTTVRVEKVR